MKRFRFRLASLLRYREFREQQARQAVSNARRALLDCEAAMARLQGRLDDARTACEREAADGVTAQRFLNFTRFAAGLETRRDAEQERRQTLLRELAACQTRLAEAAVQRRAVEKLKERRESEYNQDMAKELQKQTDEIAILHRDWKEKG
ncbi:MAG: flagellar export protein FliJ [Desulfobacterales bacterium]|jgi:flagellar protein FliJ